MLQFAPLVTAVLAGALAAAVVFLLFALMAPRRWQAIAPWNWAVGAGVLVASGVTGEWPHWPPLEDRARFLTLVVPLTLVIESLAAVLRSQRAAWVLRLVLAASVAPILLHDSVYLVAADGREVAEWTAAQATAILCGLAAALILLWALLGMLQHRTSAAAVQVVLALDALATAVTVMLSGYFGAGLLGLGLFGAIAGSALASSLKQQDSPRHDSLAMSVLGTFAVVLMGRFFGALPNGLAAGLLLAPLAAWISELPWLRTFMPRWQSVLRLACVAAALLLIVVLAIQNFRSAASAKRGPLATANAETCISLAIA